MSLYLTIELLTLSVPLALSFDKKVAYFRLWKYLFPAIVISAAFFIAVDIWFTRLGVWGFNPEYHSGIIIAHLPLEEYLFFLIIPFSSIFIHYVFLAYFPGEKIGRKSTAVLTCLLISLLVLLSLANKDRIYTSFYSAYMAILLAIAYFINSSLLSSFYLSFLIILIPFFAVNGILTGSFIEGEVVWYNASGILGLRLLTVPVEDTVYGFSMILTSLLLMNLSGNKISGGKV